MYSFFSSSLLSISFSALSSLLSSNPATSMLPYSFFIPPGSSYSLISLSVHSSSKDFLSSASPKSASPKSVSPKSASPKSASPKSALPKSTSPKSVSPKSALLKSASPKSALLKSSSPKSASPKSASPKSASPKSASSKSASPKSASPKPASPKSVSPKSASPKSAPKLPDPSSPKLLCSLLSSFFKFIPFHSDDSSSIPLSISSIYFVLYSSVSASLLFSSFSILLSST